MNDKRDILIQSRFPTLMVPAYGEISECGTDQTRLLMANDGLYVETRPPWGHLVKRVWDSPRPLPYGKMKEHDGFLDVIKEHLLAIMLEEMEPEARTMADEGKEWIGYVIWTPEDGFTYHRPEFESTAIEVKFRRHIPYNVHVVLDAHSHGSMSPFFSATDDADDTGVRISAVCGNYGNTEEGVMFNWDGRYIAEGFFMEWGLKHECDQVA